MKKLLILVIFLPLFILLQTSFLIYFSFWGVTINFIIIAVILWNFCENQKSYWGIVVALMGGILWDVFSNWPFGFHILVLLIIASAIKFLVRQYVKIPILGRN